MLVGMHMFMRMHTCKRIYALKYTHTHTFPGDAFASSTHTHTSTHAHTYIYTYIPALFSGPFPRP
jgi:hypothetical protein